MNKKSRNQIYLIQDRGFLTHSILIYLDFLVKIYQDIAEFPDALGFTLISMGKIDDTGFSLNFKGGKCEILDPKGSIVGNLKKESGLYRSPHGLCHSSANAITGLSIMDLHRRLGHLPLRAICELISKNLVAGIKLIEKDEPEECEACIQAKLTRKPVNTVRQGE